MGFRTVLLGAASALVLTAGVANAGFDRDGWYFGLEAGWVSVEDTEVAGSGLTSVDFDGGWGALGTVGYALSDSRWRIEGEIGYRENDIGATTGVALVSGELTEWSGFVNAVYDMPLHSDHWGLSLGGGIGLDNARLAFNAFNDDDKVFAAQALVGLTYRMGDHYDLMLNYRYTWADPAELIVGFAPPSVESEMDITKHTITIGLRYGYNDPPAPPPEPAAPPPPPPPPQAKQFVIFFGFNKCNITAEADAVLSEAAASAKSTGSASVRIVGHTDSVGSNEYNQKLSECRADATKSNLVGKGVAEGAISTSGKGESELMVQTGDGVKEPQNRRATVNVN